MTDSMLAKVTRCAYDCIGERTQLKHCLESFWHSVFRADIGQHDFRRVN